MHAASVHQQSCGQSFAVSAPASKVHPPAATWLCNRPDAHADWIYSLLLSRPAAVAARQVVDTGDMWVRKLEELVQRGVIPHPRTLGK